MIDDIDDASQEVIEAARASPRRLLRVTARRPDPEFMPAMALMSAKAN